MNPTPNLNAILEQGDWRQWRTSHRQDPGPLAQAARAWCSSSYWSAHTPPLEDWKIVVEDLGGQKLSEENVLQMASQDNGPRLPFPAIPLFEDEQIRDFCRTLAEPEAAAALVDQIRAYGSLLTVDPGEVAAKCWAGLSLAARGGLSFPLWRWMVAGSASREDGLPSAEQIALLLRRTGRRADAVVRALDQAVRERLESGADLEAALAAAEALSLWDDPSFFEWALGAFERAGQPELFRQRLRSAAQSGRAEFHDEALKSRLEQFDLAPQGSARTQDEKLASGLFDAPLELNKWAEVEARVLARQPGSGAAHPLRGMADHLRGLDLPELVEESAWQKLRTVLESFPVLLDVDGDEPESALPALQLAAAIRSDTTIGRVALELVAIAGDRRSQPRWWRAVRAGLRAAVRRGGFGNAGDRMNVAIRTLQVHAPWLSAAEVLAMQTGLLLENVDVRK